MSRASGGRRAASMGDVMRMQVVLLAAGLALSSGACARHDAPVASRPEGVPAAPADAGASGLSVTPATVDQVHAMAAAPGARATVVNVWATWCAPCREELPDLLEVAKAHRDRGLRLVLVSADFDSVQALRFLEQRGVDFPTWLKSGDDMGFINGLSPRWSGALPATFVYDADGRLVNFWEGKADRARFEQAVSAALSGAARPS
jgi:thiol-disulfide isomerase/thioredoxin